MLIKEGVRIAPIDHRSVILDLNSEDYFVVSGAVARALNAISKGDRELPEYHSEAFQELIGMGLVELSDHEREYTFANDKRARLECKGPLVGEPPHIRFTTRISITIAIVKTFVILKLFGLRRMIEIFESKKTKKTCPSENERHDLIYALRSMRPYFYDPKNKCVLNAFSVAFFLLRYGYHVNVKIGVSLDPFRAHCWAEDDDWLYCDTFTRIENFTVILEV